MVITEKISLDLPVLYSELIYDEFVDKGECKNRSDFIIEAVKEKLERNNIRLTPYEERKLNDWWEEEKKSILPKRIKC